MQHLKPFTHRCQAASNPAKTRTAPTAVCNATSRTATKLRLRLRLRLWATPSTTAAACSSPCLHVTSPLHVAWSRHALQLTNRELFFSLDASKGVLQALAQTPKMPPFCNACEGGPRVWIFKLRQGPGGTLWSRVGQILLLVRIKNSGIVQ